MTKTEMAKLILMGELEYEYKQGRSSDRKWMLDNLDKVIESAEWREDSGHVYLWERALSAAERVLARS